MSKGFRNIPLNPLRAFSVAIRHQTFTSAAKEMGISQVAISRQIAILEGYLGVQLFERSARSVKLTDMGRAFGHEIAPLFQELENATSKVLTGERESTVHVRIYPTYAYYWLLPKFASFKSEYPDFDIRLDTTVEPLDFRGTYLDCAIQLGFGDWRDTKSAPLFEERLDLVCSPEYAEKFNNFENIEDLNKADLLHSKYRRREWENWSIEHNVELNTIDGYEFTTSMLTYSAAEHGLGVAVGQVDLLKRQLDSGRLVCPIKKPYHSGQSFYIAWPSNASVRTKTKKFVDWALRQVDQPTVFYR